MRDKRKREDFARRERDELKWLRKRYDHGATSAAMFTIIKRPESDLAWDEHWRSLGDVAKRVLKGRS
jgi:hypothetical protein